MPDSAVQRDPVARGLTGRGVAAVGVERMAVVAGLLRAILPGDGAQRARHARSERRWSLDWWPECDTCPVAIRLRACVECEPVQGEAFGVRQQGGSADLGGLNSVSSRSRCDS